jgi:hypothetical protein
MRPRLDIEALDPEDPFELDDGNLPHLAKHAPFTAEDLNDILASDPLFYEAKSDGPADWLMVGEVPGHFTPVVVPLAKPDSGDPTKCRPIGIYEVTGQFLENYLVERGR